MLTFNFTPFPVIETERLVLRPAEENDTDAILFLRSDQQVMTYLDRDPLKSQEEALALICQMQAGIANNTGVSWAVTMKGDNQLIGTIGFWRTTPEHHRAEIGYMLHPQLQGKGIMQEAIVPVINYGFNEMKLHSIEADVNPNNIASIRLLEKNGFIREAYYRENYYYAGRYIDTAIYSLLVTSWKNASNEIPTAVIAGQTNNAG